MNRSEIMRLLAQPFPDKYIHKNPSGRGTYVKHHVVEQRLIQVFGRPPTFEVVQIVRGDVPAIEPDPNGSSDRAKQGAPALTNVVVGVIGRLSAEVSGESWIAEEAGDCEEPHNWKTDGARLKDACSDAYKRCAMRWGCGLHLWSQNEYFLYDALARLEKSGNGTTAGGESSTATAASSPTGVSA